MKRIKKHLWPAVQVGQSIQIGYEPVAKFELDLPAGTFFFPGCHQEEDGVLFVSAAEEDIPMPRPGQPYSDTVKLERWVFEAEKHGYPIQDIKGFLGYAVCRLPRETYWLFAYKAD